MTPQYSSISAVHSPSATYWVAIYDSAVPGSDCSYILGWYLVVPDQPEQPDLPYNMHAPPSCRYPSTDSDSDSDDDDAAASGILRPISSSCHRAVRTKRAGAGAFRRPSFTATNRLKRSICRNVNSAQHYHDLIPSYSPVDRSLRKSTPRKYSTSVADIAHATSCTTVHLIHTVLRKPWGPILKPKKEKEDYGNYLLRDDLKDADFLDVAAYIKAEAEAARQAKSVA